MNGNFTKRWSFHNIKEEEAIHGNTTPGTVETVETTERVQHFFFQETYPQITHGR